MKLILSGANGFIGTEILNQTLSNPAITSLIALSRKPLSITHPKLRVVIVQDFSSYTPEILEELEGSEGCIWTIGAKSLSPEITRKVTLEYSLAAARAFSGLTTRRFRFVFVSGVVAVRDQKSSVVLFGEARKIAGRAEEELLALSSKEENGGGLEVSIMRPGYVFGKEKSVGNTVMGTLPWMVGVKELASVLVDVAVNGGEGRETWLNADLKKRGKELVGREK